ncbi:hypothetical protein ADS79_23040 [Brevibacillus reuszeri]|uniref:Uncharacterized protein n=1 Tax=Brevibacillus reuszeri TaxID=54915 RepID=A0A0K9YSL4_9BACL|nr:hypothetical protein ADS79_23040 [Brevibacillus reuszeri]
MSSYSDGEEKGENAADSWVTSWGSFLYGCMEKEKPRPKSFLQEAAQGWTLKGVFLFFHSTWVGAPKICRLFLLFPRCQLWWETRAVFVGISRWTKRNAGVFLRSRLMVCSF